MVKKNLFCKISDLVNESDVEQFFAIRLLSYLHYDDTSIKTKKSLDELTVSRGSRSEKYKPDYVCFYDKKPKIVIDTKSPSENIDDYIYQVSGYALSLNQKFKNENPIRFTILTNGLSFKIFNWDEEEPILSLNFEDFAKGNKKFEELIELISFETIKNQTGKNELKIGDFFSKPSVEEIKAAFNKCHNIIWKKEKISPTDAFYEFSKIIFVKLNEDKRIREIIKSGQKLKRTDFKFSIDWINERENETEKPLSSILFRDLQSHLQEQIEKNKKKPIFQKDEEVELKSQTIKEVVKILQDKDLYTIDEDLNGRMFETFLNATVRGRELGQYFTPRKVVKFMTKLADLQLKRVGGEIIIDSVLDACCGSGGFLIDALADFIEKAKNNPILTPHKDEVLEKIKTDSIFGIEANPKISRIARMNMYVHGDGGSRIYCADSLDKEVLISRGTNKGIKKELEELKTHLVTNQKKFDVVLSNPPFSMSYKNKEKDEQDILLQYASSDQSQNLTYEKDTNKLRASVKSNVLFLARYADLLKAGGRMLIVLDNSVLNSYSHIDYRDFIRNNFIIHAVFQLPTHTFVNQEAGGITSILYVEKKKSASQEQSSVFARVVNKVGHGTSGKEEDQDDFENILAEYKKYESEGKLYWEGKKSIGDYENDDLFLIDSKRLDDRLDVYFHQPSYYKLLNEIKSSEKSGRCIIKKLSDFERISNSESDFPEDETIIYKYIEISAVDKERGFIISDAWEEGTRDKLPNRAKMLIKENDILFSKPYRSLQKVVIVPKELDGQIASSGFYGIRPKDFSEACVLWGIFRSLIIQKQFIHLSSGYTQRELNDEYLEKYLFVPIPKNADRLAKKIFEEVDIAKKARSSEIQAINLITHEPEREILGNT